MHKYYRPVALILVMLLGLSSGYFVDSLLRIKLRPNDTLVDRIGDEVSTVVRKVSAADLDYILQNNIFDKNNRSSTARMDFKAGPQVEETSESKSRVDIKLIGTVVSDTQALALLEATKKIEIYYLGEEVPGGGTIEDIGRSQVRIKYPDQTETTLLFQEQNSSRASSAKVPKSTRDRSGTIREVGENRWLVSQDMVDSVRENFATQLRLAQMQPRLLDGKTEGFLVQRIYPRSVLAKMGLKKGDVVIDVNNIKLDSPEKALQVFQQLREARKVNVSVERSGQPMTFVYEIE